MNGNSLTEMNKDIQEHLGICNQFDYFWPSFTPRQMFNVVGTMKGMERSLISSELERLLALFKLQAYTDRDSKECDLFVL